jgi:ketosteroid isomerase-like protein
LQRTRIAPARAAILSFGRSARAAVTDDAYFLPPTHKVIEGPKGVAEFFSGLVKGGVTGHKLEMIEAEGNGNIVYAAARWSAKGKDDKGKPKELSGLATHIFEKQSDGSLKLKLQTFN